MRLKKIAVAKILKETIGLTTRLLQMPEARFMIMISRPKILEKETTTLSIT